MNKKLLTVAIGTALAASPMLAAQADAKFFGHAQVEISAQDSELNTRDASGSIANPGFDGIAVEDRARGRFGFKAKEDLGNGMKGLVHFAWRVDTSDNTAGSTGNRQIRNRETSVGLQAGWGTIKLGNIKTPYKYTGGVKYDAFVATTLEARGNGAMTGNELNRIWNGATSGVLQGAYGHNNFMSNAVSYKNKFGNFRVWVALGFDENGDNRGSDGDINASLLYSAGNWEAFVAIVSRNDEQTPGFATPAGVQPVSYDSTKVGGKFKFGGNMTVFAQLESGTLKDETFAGLLDVDIDTMFIGWQMKMGKNTFVAQYGQQTHDGLFPAIVGSGPTFCQSLNGELDTDYLSLGVIHKFTKKTRVWAGYRKTEYSGDNCVDAAGATSTSAEDTAISVGIRKDF